jgi:hypothetical protein
MSKPKPVNWGKKLKDAYFQGYGEGAEAAHKAWIEVCERTSGVGPKTRDKLLDSARIIASEKMINRR